LIKLASSHSLDEWYASFEDGNEHDTSVSYRTNNEIHTFKVNEETTTETEEKAIAKAAIIGCKCRPQGKNTPIAKGIMRTL